MCDGYHPLALACTGTSSQSAMEKFIGMCRARAMKFTSKRKVIRFLMTVVMFTDTIYSQTPSRENGKVHSRLPSFLRHAADP